MTMPESYCISRSHLGVACILSGCSAIWRSPCSNCEDTSHGDAAIDHGQFSCFHLVLRQ